MWWLELRVPPVVVAMIHGVGMWVLSGMGDPPVEFMTPLGLAAGSLVLVGATLAVVAVVQFRASHTTVDPRDPTASSAMVTTGVYGFSRNPMYLAIALILAEWSLYLGGAMSMLLVPSFVLYIARFQIRPEEQALLQLFGAEYVKSSGAPGRRI